jgi:hypothetical protein
LAGLGPAFTDAASSLHERSRVDIAPAPEIGHYVVFVGDGAVAFAQ